MVRSPLRSTAQDLGGSFPSVRATLVHLGAAALLWRFRLQGTSPTAMATDLDYPTFEGARTLLFAEHDALGQIAAASLERLDTVLIWRTMKGQEMRLPLWAVFRHLVNHGSYHRGQIATMLRRLGVKPPSTDLLFWALPQLNR